MNRNIKELKMMILEKNEVLDNLCCNKGENRERIDREKRELDRLLYRYFKTYKFEHCEKALT